MCHIRPKKNFCLGTYTVIFRLCGLAWREVSKKNLATYPSAKDAVLIHPSDSILRRLYHKAFAHISTARIKGVELSTIKAMQYAMSMSGRNRSIRQTLPRLLGQLNFNAHAWWRKHSRNSDITRRSQLPRPHRPGAGLEYTKTLNYETTAKILGGFITEIYSASRRKLQR